MKAIAAHCDAEFETFLIRKGHGRIQSVFDHALNFVSEDETLYSLLVPKTNPEEYQAPYSATLASNLLFQTLEIPIGSLCTWENKNFLVSSNLKVDFSRCKHTELSLVSAPWNSEIIKRSLHVFDSHIKRSSFSSACAGWYQNTYCSKWFKRDIFEHMLDRKIEMFIKAMEAQCYRLLETKLLLGAGPGLTPAGDDFLCGWLCIAQKLDNATIESSLKALIESIDKPQMLAKTNIVSKQMLTAACKGLFSSPYLALRKALLTAPDALEAALTPLYCIGHSSGMDFAIGAACALRTYQHITQKGA